MIRVKPAARQMSGAGVVTGPTAQECCSGVTCADLHITTPVDAPARRSSILLGVMSNTSNTREQALMGSSDARMMTFHVPPDRELLAAFGELSLRHEHLTHILRMTIKTVANLEVSEALDATAYEGAAALRARISRLARQRLGEGRPLLQLQALLERCSRASGKRNELVHSVWAKELDGEPKLRTNDHGWRDLPSVHQLNELSSEIDELTKTLNHARLDGFLAEELRSRPLSK